MRIRTIKPEFWSSFSIARLSEPALILAIGLLNMSCDAGYFEADPRLIKAAIFPLREPSASIPACLGELSRIEFIALRNATDGRLVGKVINFLRHQRIDKPAKTVSKVSVDFGNGTDAEQFAKNPQESRGLFSEHSNTPPVVLPESSGKKTAGTGNREQGKEGEQGSGDSSEVAGATPSTTFLIFPTVGDPSEWTLTYEQVVDWKGIFAWDVEAECRVALGWVKANPTKRKTAAGMKRFLFKWLTRANDRGGQSPFSGGHGKPPPSPTSDDDHTKGF